MHPSSAEIFRRKPDFRVTYHIYSPEEGRYSQAFQRIRWNFRYEHPAHVAWANFIIYPEFKDFAGHLIKDTTLPLPFYGMANMWILDKAMIDYHRGKIRIGTHGYFMEGK